MSQVNVTWTKGALPPRFGYFVEGQSNAVGRPVGDIFVLVTFLIRFSHSNAFFLLLTVFFIFSTFDRESRKNKKHSEEQKNALLWENRSKKVTFVG